MISVTNNLQIFYNSFHIVKDVKINGNDAEKIYVSHLPCKVGEASSPAGLFFSHLQEGDSRIE